MTPAQKTVIKMLLTGHFLRLMKRRDHSWYVVYDAKINPITKVRKATVEKLDRFMDPKTKLWKRAKNGDMTLNLNTVRQLHGKNTIKKLYKQKDELTTSGTIYKPRKKKIKSTNQNEKVHYLF